MFVMIDYHRKEQVRKIFYLPHALVEELKELRLNNVDLSGEFIDASESPTSLGYTLHRLDNLLTDESTMHTAYNIRSMIDNGYMVVLDAPPDFPYGNYGKSLPE